MNIRVGVAVNVVLLFGRRAQYVHTQVIGDWLRHEKSERHVVAEQRRRVRSVFEPRDRCSTFKSSNNSHEHVDSFSAKNKMF